MQQHFTEQQQNVHSFKADFLLRVPPGAVCLHQWLSHLTMHQTLLEGLLHHRLWEPHPRVFDSVGLGWGLRISISNKFSGDVDADGLRTTPRQPLRLLQSNLVPPHFLEMTALPPCLCSWLFSLLRMPFSYTPPLWTCTELSSWDESLSSWVSVSLHIYFVT